MKKMVLAMSVVLAAAVCAAGEGRRSWPWSPLGIGIAAPVQLPFTDSDVYGLRIGGLLGMERDVIGLDVGLVEMTRGGFTGLQVAGFSWTGADVCGLQFSAAGNIALGSAVGGVFGLCNVFYGDVTGFELGAVNYDASLAGVQSGAVNWNRFDSAGAQVGAFNWNDAAFTGCAVGALSFSDGFTGAQIGFVNSANTVTGVQIGAVNACESITGVQIGLINLIASSPVSAMIVANMMF